MRRTTWLSAFVLYSNVSLEIRAHTLVLRGLQSLALEPTCCSDLSGLAPRLELCYIRGSCCRVCWKDGFVFRIDYRFDTASVVVAVVVDEIDGGNQGK